MTASVYPNHEKRLIAQRTRLAPRQEAAFRQLNAIVFDDGALSARSKQLIAVAVAHVTQCPYCIRGHVKAARRAGAKREEIMEAIWVAAEMRAGAAYAHSLVAIDVLDESEASG